MGSIGIVISLYCIFLFSSACYLFMQDLGGRDIIVNFPERVQSTGSGYRIYVGNLAWSVKREAIRVLFNQYGNVSGLRLNYDRQNGVPRVYGFVFLSVRSEVEAAVAALNGKVITLGDSVLLGFCQ